MNIGKLPIRIFGLIIANDLLDTASQLMMKKGLGDSDYPSFPAFAAFLLNLQNPFILLFWAGVVICVLNFFLWMHILSKVQLSVALPLASVSYILVPLSAVIFLHEHVGPLRWAGLVFIILGIYCISKSQTAASG